MAKYERFELNETYYILCILGGIIRQNDNKSVWKLVWILYNCSSSLLIVSSSLFAVSTSKYINIDYLVRSVGALLFTPVIWSIYFLVASRFDDLIKLMNAIDREHEHNDPAPKTKDKSLYFALTFVSLAPYFFYIAKAGKQLLKNVPQVLDVTFYIYPVPYVRINSVPMYLAVGFVQATTFLPIVVVETSSLKVAYNLAHVIREKLFALRENIESSTRSASNELESSHEREMNTTCIDICRRLRLNRLEKEIRKEAGEKFRTKIVVHAQKIALIMRYLLSLKKLYDPICSVMILISSFMLIYVGNLSYSEVFVYSKNQNYDYIVFISTLMGQLCVVLKLHNLGTMINNEIEGISFAIYDTPWYLLPPTNRKDTFILLCATQKRICFKAFKYLPMDNATAPMVLYTCYSYVLGLQTLLAKRR